MHPNGYQLIHNLVLHFIQSFSISVVEFKQKDDKYGLAGFAHYILQIIGQGVNSESKNAL